MLGQTPTPSPAADPIAGVSGGEAVWLIVGIAAGLALLWAIPMYLDARRAYKAYKYLQIPLMKDLLAAAESGNLELTDEQKGLIVGAATDRFEATAGLARALMAFAVISILSVALVAVLVSDASDADDLRKTIITALVSILGTIVGFYFGARTAEIGTAAARENPEDRERREQRERERERERDRDRERERQGDRSRSTRQRSTEREKPAEPEKPG